MAETIIYIEGGKIMNKAAVAKAFGALADGRYLMKIDSAKKRTLSQNAYYFSVVVPMVKDGLIDAGFAEVQTNEDAHLIMKSLFLKRHVVNPNTGEAIEWVESTTKLKTVEFNAFLEKVWMWAAQYLSIQIPQPNEQLSLHE